MEISKTSIVKLSSCSPHNYSKRVTTENNDDDEQSSWTFYIEDFMTNKDGYISCVSSEGPSQASDVASLMAKKSSCRINCRNLSFKRQRTKKVWVDNYDDDLEDTASSPLNSPKDQGIVWEQINEKNVELQIGETDKSYIELKKRGLCLVPVFILANFINN